MKSPTAEKKARASIWVERPVRVRLQITCASVLIISQYFVCTHVGQAGPGIKWSRGGRRTHGESTRVDGVQGNL